MAEPNDTFRICPDYRTRPRDCAGVREQKLADGGYYVCTFCRDAKQPTPKQEKPDAAKP